MISQKVQIFYFTKKLKLLFHENFKFVISQKVQVCDFTKSLNLWFHKTIKFVIHENNNVRVGWMTEVL